MEGQNFFAGLLKGFGTGMLDSRQQAAQQQQQQETARQTQVLNLFTKGIEAEWIDPVLGYTEIAKIYQDILGGGTKGTNKALAALFDPENFGPFAAGIHTTLGGQQVRTGKAGPTGITTVGPAPMGRTNPPEMRPQSVTPAPAAETPEDATTDAPPRQPPDAPPLAPLPTRQTMVGPPARLWNTPAERQRRLLEAETNKQAATVQGGFEGRIRVAEQHLRQSTEIFRRDHHREPTPPEQQAMRDKSYALFGMDVNAGRAATEKRYAEGNIIPDTKSPTGYSQQLYNPADPSDTRTIPAPGPRMVEGNIVQDPMSTTGWVQEVYDPTNPDRKYRIPVADPMARSTRTVTDLEAIVYELYGDKEKKEDPRTLLTTPGRITPAQLEQAQAVQRERVVAQAGKVTEAREREKLEAAQQRILRPQDAAAMQVPYGLTGEQAAAVGRVPLTAVQIPAAAASFALDRDVTEAEILFEKVWPRIAQPEARRTALGLLQRNQQPDFVKLQAALARIPLNQSVMAQGSRPSDTDMLIFKQGMPNTQSGNWDLVEVPSSYESGKALLAATRKMITDAQTDLGLVKPDERRRSTQPTAPGYTIDGRGNIRDGKGTIISGPDKPR